MPISLAELESRIRAARDQEHILLWLLGDQTALIIGPDEIPQRIEALGDTYQCVIGAFNALMEDQAKRRSQETHDQGTQHAGERAT